MAESPNGAGQTTVDLIEKAATEEGVAAQRLSVVEENPSVGIGDQMHGRGEDFGLLFAMAVKGDGIIPWGTSPSARDRQLRAYLPTESMLAGALGSVTARNAAMPWVLRGPEQTRDAVHDVLVNAEFGQGWTTFISKLSWDYYSQDKGAFVEFIRAADSPESPVIGLKHLDAGRCWSTGRREEPVLYRDINNKIHKLKWYQVHHLSEMPTPHEDFWGLQLCAASRVMRASQVWRNINIYMDEKTGGRHTRAIHFVNGATDTQIKTAVEVAQAQSDSQLRERFGQIPIVTSVQKDLTVSTATLELASLPDGFDSEKAIKEYLIVLSLGFLVDFQEFAPLPGGNLGTSSQSEVLAAKSRAKGPALFRKHIEHMLNQAGVMPEGVQFTFDIVDPEEDARVAENANTRADTVSKLVASGVLDGTAGLQLLIDSGDVPEEIAAAMGARDIVPGGETQTDVPITDSEVKAVSEPRKRAEAAAADNVEDILDFMRERIEERVAASA